MASHPRIAMVAGEASGDLLAGLLLDGLQARWPELQAKGIGGPQMARRGFECLWPSEKLAVHGYSMEVLRRLRELLGIRKQLRERLLRERPGYSLAWTPRISTWGWRQICALRASKRCTLCAPRSGPGAPSGWRNSGAAPTMSCASSLSSLNCWPGKGLRRPTLGIRWPMSSPGARPRWCARRTGLCP